MSVNVFIDDKLIPNIIALKLGANSWNIYEDEELNDTERTGSLFFDAETTLSQLKDDYLGKTLPLRIESYNNHGFVGTVKFYYIEQSASQKTDWEPTTELCFSEWPVIGDASE